MDSRSMLAKLNLQRSNSLQLKQAMTEKRSSRDPEMFLWGFLNKERILQSPTFSWVNKQETYDPTLIPQACISDSWLMSFWVSLIFSIVSSLFKYSYARISGSEIYKFAFLWYYWWGWSCFNVNMYPFWWNFCQPASVVV